jgi:hypothetical protein
MRRILLFIKFAIAILLILLIGRFHSAKPAKIEQRPQFIWNNTTP